MSVTHENPAVQANEKPAEPSGGPTGSNDDQAARQEHEIEVIRENLGGLITELDVRRHNLRPARVIGRHPLTFAAALLGAAGLGVGVGVLLWKRGPKRRSWASASDRARALFERAKRLGRAVGRAADSPDDVARPSPNIPKKILAAAAATAAGMGTRRLLARYLEQKPM